MRHFYHYLWSRPGLTVINRPIPGDLSHVLIASPRVSQIGDKRKTKRPAPLGRSLSFLHVNWPALSAGILCYSSRSWAWWLPCTSILEVHTLSSFPLLTQKK